MSLMSLFKKDIKIEETKRFVDLIQENNDLKTENAILYRALVKSCMKTYKFTGNFDENNPEYFIDQIKMRIP